MYMDSGYTFGVCIENGSYDEKFVNITQERAEKKDYYQRRVMSK